MKTTVEISDSLFEAARSCASARGVTFRQIVEEGIRAVLEQQQRPQEAFRLRDGSFGGDSVHPGLTWTEIRQRIYEGRGE